MIELVLAAATLAAPAQLSTRVVDGVLEIRGPRAAWKNREVHKTAERNVIFVPGVSVTAVDQKSSGLELQSYDAKRGAVIVVKPGSAKLTDHVRYLGPASAPASPVERRTPRLEGHASESAAPVRPEERRKPRLEGHASESAAPVRPEERRKPRLEGRASESAAPVRPEERRKPRLEGRASESRGSVLPLPVARDLAARSTRTRKNPPPAAPVRPEERRKPPLEGRASPDQTAAPEAAAAATGLDRIRTEPGSGMIRTLGVIALLALLGAVAWWLNRRKGVPDLDGGSIQILSVKPLGPKHRLAIIEAAGERLLIAATDGEVRLLSSLGYSAATAPAPVDEAPVRGEDEHASEDVAGLLRLREESAARDFESVLQSVNPTQYVA